MAVGGVARNFTWILLGSALWGPLNTSGLKALCVLVGSLASRVPFLSRSASLPSDLDLVWACRALLRWGVQQPEQALPGTDTFCPNATEHEKS